jgi:hypothetical protein
VFRQSQTWRVWVREPRRKSKYCREQQKQFQNCNGKFFCADVPCFISVPLSVRRCFTRLAHYEQIVHAKHSGFEVLTAVVLKLHCLGHNSALFRRRQNCSARSMFLRKQSQGNKLFSSVSEIDRSAIEADSASLAPVSRINGPFCSSQTVLHRKSG